MSQPFNTILALDFESTWCRKSGYSLSVMTTEEYIRDERFKAWGVCIHEYGTDKITNWYRHDELPRIFATYDWSKTAIVAQNALFDASILAWVYDVHPCFIFDTLSMARARRGVEIGNSLAMLAKAFGLPDKGGDLALSEGYFDSLPAEIEHKLAEYCKHDVWLCEQVFERLIEGYPAKELRLIDMTIKMYTEAKLVLDTPMLVDALHEEKESREALLERLQITDSVLASNDQFAEALRTLGITPPTKKKKPTAKTPKPVGVNFAFAKTDAMFQAMLNGENEDVRLLCEARLKVKSTTERTRAQRFLDISRRGPLPVPLSYFGAGTGRWTASKGSAINMQNLKRGSFLRKAIMAPEGYAIAVGDLSQIEPRVLAWLADYEELLDIFRSGQDAYAMFGRQMFNLPELTKEGNPMLRQSAKSALLGCLSGDTPVLTNNGYKRMVEVQLTDLLWDGAAWVAHQGLLDKGEKEVWTYNGLTATADHKILTGNRWYEWHAVLTNPLLFQQALSSAVLPASSGGNVNPRAGIASTHRGCYAPADIKAFQAKVAYCQEKQNDARIAKIAPQSLRSDSALKNRFRLVWAKALANLPVQAGEGVTAHTTPPCVVRAGGRGSLTDITLQQGAVHDAERVHSRRPLQHATQCSGTKQFAQTMRTVTDSLTGSARSSCGARIQTAPSILTTAGAALASTLLGWKTALSSCATSLVSMVGINPNYSLTAQTTTGGTNRATFASSHAASTCPTSARSRHAKLSHLNEPLPPLKQRMQTYDIAYAGPRNRYTILTDEGPLIVHNCGYGLGWASFAAQLLVGFLGAPPVRYDKDFAKSLGVTAQTAEKFLEWDDNVKKLEEIPHTCTMRELVIHCLAAKAIIDKYRVTAEPVVALWALFGHLIQYSLYEGKEYTHKCVTFKKGEIVLPSGMSLLYPDLKPGKDEKGRLQWTYGKDETKLYAGKITNNVTQGVARCVMTDGMVRTAKKYFVAGTVHDEQLALVPEAGAEDAKTWVLAQMVVEPKYMPGIPLAADGGVHKRYGLAKN